MRRKFKQIIGNMLYKTLCENSDFSLTQATSIAAYKDAKQAKMIADEAKDLADELDATMSHDVLPTIDRIKIDWKELEKKSPGITEKVRNIWRKEK